MSDESYPTHNLPPLDEQTPAKPDEAAASEEGNDPNPGLPSSEGDLSDKAEKPTEDRGFQYPTHLDAQRQRLGGVYLDDVQREKAEIARAKVEDREPDLKNPPAMQSTPLVPSATLKRLDPRAVGRDDDVTLPVGV